MVATWKNLWNEIHRNYLHESQRFTAAWNYQRLFNSFSRWWLAAIESARMAWNTFQVQYISKLPVGQDEMSRFEVEAIKIRANIVSRIRCQCVRFAAIKNVSLKLISAINLVAKQICIHAAISQLHLHSHSCKQVFKTARRSYDNYGL